MRFVILKFDISFIIFHLSPENPTPLTGRGLNTEISYVLGGHFFVSKGK